MKKNLFRISMVAMCAILMSGVMTSCSEKKNNTPDVPEEQQPTEEKIIPVAVRAEATYTTTEEVMKVFDLTVDYYDNEGKLQHVTLTEPKFNLNTKAPLPNKAGMNVNLKLKDGINLESIDTVNVYYEFSSICVAVDANNEIAGDEHKIPNNPSEFNLPSSKVQAWLDTYAKAQPAGFLYEYDAEGYSKVLIW